MGIYDSLFDVSTKNLLCGISRRSQAANHAAHYNTNYSFSTVSARIGK